MKKALFPGTFDPITYGHIEIIERGLKLFDQIVIGIGSNTAKNTMFTQLQRSAWIKKYFANESKITVELYNNLTVQFARSINAQFILRGLRNAPDFEYERNIDLLNKHLDSSIETIYIISSPKTAHISSTLVREVIRYRGDLQGLVPELIIKDIYALEA
ncbi:MAG: pantetheine-phosphate adenylyltransferase [Bacteroidia bacterium]|nr:pantetheine-phosphate adenylyltransferase [Bacteroidia bacterium]MDW8158932.1 pantetheine-phosphate adenylyltransferase [Bacteroidia bacterium]